MEQTFASMQAKQDSFVQDLQAQLDDWVVEYGENAEVVAGEINYVTSDHTRACVADKYVLYDQGTETFEDEETGETSDDSFRVTFIVAFGDIVECEIEAMKKNINTERWAIIMPDLGSIVYSTDEGDERQEMSEPFEIEEADSFHLVFRQYPNEY